MDNPLNQVLDQETAQLVAEELGHKVILRNENELEEEVLAIAMLMLKSKLVHRL